MPVILVGTLDTKGEEVAFVRDLLSASGLTVRVVDAGSSGPPSFAPDVPREVVFRRAGTTFEAINAQGDRGHAVALAAEGVTGLVADWDALGHVDGIFGLGGSAGTTIATAAMRILPFGRPKLLVSTLASGQMRPYVGGSDITTVHPVADLAGLNRLTRTALANAAAAFAGMVHGQSTPSRSEPAEARPLVGASMFGVTTPCVDRARRLLEVAGKEVIVFHATGVGGQSLEGLTRDGAFAGLLDLTTTELADERVGGTLSAGPDRLGAAARAGIPQVVSVGALDMVNFGPPSTIPPRFANRLFHGHNPNVTLMRTTPEENRDLGEHLARMVRQSQGPTVVLLPLQGVSALDAPNQPFHDPQADAALFAAIRHGLAGAPSHIRLIERDEHINDPRFATAAASLLLEILAGQPTFAPRR